MVETFVDFSQARHTPRNIRVGNVGQGTDRVYLMAPNSTDTNASPANTIRAGVLVKTCYVTASLYYVVAPYRIPTDLALGTPISGITLDDVKTVDPNGTAAYNPVPVMTFGFVEARNIWHETATAGTLVRLSVLGQTDAGSFWAVINALAGKGLRDIASPITSSSPARPFTHPLNKVVSPYLTSPMLELGVQIFVRV